MELRKSALADEELRMSLFQKIIDSVSFDDNFLILVGCDSYDVPFKSKDDETQADASNEVYTYLLCAVCPVKQTKPNLHYVPETKEFHDGGVNNIVSAPELGFLFPAFDNRATNIYNALLYTRNTKESCQPFAESLFNLQIPMPAAEQKKSFEAILSASLDDECSLEVVQNVHDQLCQSIELHKESKAADPLLVSKSQVQSYLTSSGISEEHLAKFSVAFDETFGYDAELHPKNIIDNKRFEISTPDVSIKVNPARSDLIETRVIGGVKYILICADESVEVNGVNIHFDEKDVSPVG